MENQKKNEKQNVQKNKTDKTSIIIFAVVLLLILGVFFFLKSLMPSYMFNQGKKYYSIGNYTKALHLFNMVANARPYETEPVYYQALTLAKLPPTYENQKALYEIAQLEDCDEASELAENVLAEMRKQFTLQVGPNYIDNVLYDGLLIRWNTSEPITYAISGKPDVPSEYFNVVRSAFENWQTATNGKILFKEVNNTKVANIVVRFVDDILSNENYVIEQTGKTVPDYKDDVLNRMDIYLKIFDSKGQNFTREKFMTLAQHEVGHAIGLSGHSVDEDDVMFYQNDTIDENTELQWISDKDVNTMMLVYKMVPDVINKPIPESEYVNLYAHEIFTTYPGENFELETQKLIDALHRDRTNLIIWVDLAINYAYKRQYARSNYILEKVLPLAESDVRNQHVILYNLAVNYYKMKNYPIAEKYLNLAKSINDDLETQILETFIDYRLNRVSIAKDKLKLLIRQEPTNVEIALKLAEVYHNEKNLKAEKETIDNLIKKNPKALRDRRVLKYKKQRSN